jgi:predicted dehydrogenase
MSIKYTSAVVGLGRIGASYPSDSIPRTHTAAYLKHPQVMMIAAVDPDAATREQFREKWGSDIKLFSSVKDMLADKVYPDIVSVCTAPDILQSNVYELITYTPKLFFLEKPTVSTKEQSEKLLQIIGNIPTAINYHRCWDTKHQIFFEELTDKEILTIRVLYTKGLLNYASHFIALLINNFGSVKTVSKIANEQKNKKFNDQSYSFMLHFEKGLDAIFQGFDHISYDLLEIDFITDSGIYSLKSGGCRQRYEQPVKDVFYPNYTSLIDAQLEIQDGQVEGLSQAVDNIVNYLDHETNQLQCDLKCGLEVFNIIKQIKDLYKS